MALGLSRRTSAGKSVTEARNAVVTATATSEPNLTSGGTSDVVSTPKPPATAMKLKNSARPVSG